jgi:hypothetical protein
VTPTEPELDVSHLSARTLRLSDRGIPPGRTTAHPAGTTRSAPPLPTGAVVAPVPAPVPASLPAPVLTLVPAVPSPPAVVRTVAPTEPPSSQEGSLVAEYGLLAVVAATVAGVLISWASSGALATFFGQLLQHARSLVVS